MKKYKIFSLLFVFIICGLVFESCQKTNDVVTPVQKQNEPEDPQLVFTKKTSPVIFEITSTGCPGCGSWGKPAFKDIVSSNQADVTPLAIHIKYGDPMITDESNAIGNNRHGQRYTPQIWVSDSNAVVLNSGYIVSQASKEKANELISTAKTIEQPALSALIEKAGDSWNVKYGVKFMDVASDGEYGLACFLTEDGIEAQQTSSASNPTIHNHVIRTSANGAFGESFTSADMTDDEKIWEHSFDISQYNSENVYITLVLWKKVGERYEPVNGYVIK